MGRMTYELFAWYEPLLMTLMMIWMKIKWWIKWWWMILSLFLMAMVVGRCKEAGGKWE